jgi:cell wall-associated NlpC family hydrolase
VSTTARTSLVTAAGVLLLLCVFLIGIPAAALGTVSGSGVCGPGGTAQTVVDQQLDAEQLANAATIVQVTASRGLPQRAAVIALATAYQESKFVNYQYPTDATTSIGLFAQMTIYYGADVAADPAQATGAFLDRLIQQPNWATRPLTDVAADVEKPYEPYRGLYAQWEPLATQLTAQLWNTSSRTAPSSKAQFGATVGTVVASPCPGAGGDGSADAAASPPAGPNGLTLTGSTQGNGAVQFAITQIGEPYVYGANGPNSWDCSSLVQAAWGSQGVSIPRTTYVQANAGIPVALADARSGDLVLIPGSDGTAANPGHVGMVAGIDATGHVWLVEAPRTGLNVRLTAITAWAGLIVTIRRIG